MLMQKQTQILRLKLIQQANHAPLIKADRDINNNEKQTGQSNSLTLSYICFEKIQPSIKQILQDRFYRLQELKINNCDLRTFQNFPYLPKLTDLNVAKNALQGTLQFLVKNKTISYLDISDNIIKDAKKLEPLKRLKKVSIYAKNNPFYNLHYSANGKSLSGTSKDSLSNKLKALGIQILKAPKESRISRVEIQNKSVQDSDVNKNKPEKKPAGILKKKQKKSSSNNPFCVKNGEGQNQVVDEMRSVSDLIKWRQLQSYISSRQGESNRSRNGILSLGRSSQIVIDDMKAFRERVRQAQLRRRDRQDNETNLSRFPDFKNSSRIIERVHHFYQNKDLLHQVMGIRKRNPSPEEDDNSLLQGLSVSQSQEDQPVRNRANSRQRLGALKIDQLVRRSSQASNENYNRQLDTILRIKTTANPNPSDQKNSGSASNKNREDANNQNKESKIWFSDEQEEEDDDSLAPQQQLQMFIENQEGLDELSEDESASQNAFSERNYLFDNNNNQNQNNNLGLGIDLAQDDFIQPPMMRIDYMEEIDSVPFGDIIVNDSDNKQRNNQNEQAQE